MSTTLSQTELAAMPDRGDVGVSASCDVGNDGAFISHDLGSEQAVLHVRLLMNPGDASGGMARVAGGEDDAGSPTWWLDYDADARALTTTLAEGTTLQATLNGMSWHTVELKVDTTANEVELWVNGLSVDTATGSFGSLATRYVWLGVVFKDTAMAGTLYLDEWRIATEWIGPVLREPRSAYADAPERWLVIYNTADTESVQWAEEYRATRDLPLANMLGLNLPVAETINASQFADLNDAIEAYLNETGLGAGDGYSRRLSRAGLCGLQRQWHARCGARALAPIRCAAGDCSKQQCRRRVADPPCV